MAFTIRDIKVVPRPEPDDARIRIQVEDNGAIHGIEFVNRADMIEKLSDLRSDPPDGWERKLRLAAREQMKTDPELEGLERLKLAREPQEPKEGR